jgi:peptidoglycan-associated lipoprotein
MHVRTLDTAVLVGIGTAALVLAVACHPSRPPAVLTAPPGEAATDSTRGPGERGSATSASESDIQSVANEGIESADLESAITTEQTSPLADVSFPYNEAALTDEARATLEKHAAWLQTRRELRVLIEGHCDERGTVGYNLALGERRAQAARDYLVSLGVSQGRLTTVSLGKERPLDLGHDESAWAHNRRDHFVVAR